MIKQQFLSRRFVKQLFVIIVCGICIYGGIRNQLNNTYVVQMHQEMDTESHNIHTIDVSIVNLRIRHNLWSNMFCRWVLRS